MGRKKIDAEKKKGKLSVTISGDNFEKIQEFEIRNKSKFINWLLEEHFNMTEIKNDIR